MPIDLSSLLDAAAREISETLQVGYRERAREVFEPDPHQRKAIDSAASLLRILAPAGSGKTATLVEKALRIVESDSRARILMVTFTNAGVNAFNNAVRARAPHFQARCSATTLNKFGFHSLKSIEQSIKQFPRTNPSTHTRHWSSLP